MSCIYFHSPIGQVEVRRNERASFGIRASEALAMSLGLGAEFVDKELLSSVISLLASPPIYVQNGDARTLRTYLSVSSGGQFVLGDQTTINSWICGLNTVIATGSDPMILSARIHGQCEVHGYVEGTDREWLARIILNGRSVGFYRKDMGWEALVDMLVARDDEPVVMSYSVCDQFPNRHVAERSGLWAPTDVDGDGDEWYDLPEEEQWSLCLAALRQDPWLRLEPGRWRWPEYFFDVPVTGFHVLDAAQAKLKLAGVG